MSRVKRAIGQKRRRTAVRFGRSAELVCRTALRLKGYSILAANLRTPVGEIDIIARRGDIVAFVEVKARLSTADDGEVLSAKQRQRIVRAADWFLVGHPNLASLGRRFDLMRVRPGHWPEHIRDAWRPTL